jgi:YidC/Oxa1 family membrane protein insertase
MNPFSTIYNFIFYQPIFSVLSFLYNYFHDFGLAVILLTLLVRILLFPFALQASKMQKKMNKIQKELEEIERKCDGEEKTKKIFEIYQKEKINPFFGIFSLFFQLPILVALYQVFLKGVKEISGDPKFLSIFDLSKPNFFLTILILFSQFFYFKYQTKGKEKSSAIGLFQEQLNYLLLFFTFLILIKLPSAISLYLFINFLFLIFQAKFFHA